ncbi:MAG: hypothetical protein V1918_05800 [Planctomycetota bacterium]
MLVMAAAGLDGMVKQPIRDTMPDLVDTDENVRSGLETFVERKVRGDDKDPEYFGGNKFIARLLASKSHQKQAIEEYVRSLTGGSLQSVEQLFQVANALCIESQRVGLDNKDRAQVQEIFNIRNKIIHELDMDLQGKHRKRTPRNIEDMKKHTDKLLGIGASLINQVNRKLSKQSAIE